jgi:hypothetical protein
MIVALSLLGYAGVLLTASARALSRARWPDSAPALGVPEFGHRS